MSIESILAKIKIALCHVRFTHQIYITQASAQIHHQFALENRVYELRTLFYRVGSRER